VVTFLARKDDLMRTRVAALVAFVTACAMMLCLSGPASAASVNPSTIAADITAAAGPSASLVAPSIDDLVFSPDTGDVTSVTQGNLTIWPNVQPGVSHAARFLNTNTTQQFVHISDPEAPTTFTYRLKPGIIARSAPSGGAVLMSSSGQILANVPAPWAKDAQGKLVPTRFKVSPHGTSIAKIVEHHSSNVAYPVVADPIMIWVAIVGAAALWKCAINGTWEASQLRGRKWYIVLWRIGWVCVVP
jgi:hypothetical protein